MNYYYYLLSLKIKIEKFAKYFINPFILTKNLVISRGSSSIMEKQIVIKLIMVIFN